MVGVVGLAPTVSCGGRVYSPMGFLIFLHTRKLVVPTGVEPILPPYQGGVLPLNYGTMAGGKRFELLLPQSKCDVLPLHQPPMVLSVGLEPTTYRLQGGCSTY